MSTTVHVTFDQPIDVAAGANTGTLVVNGDAMDWTGPFTAVTTADADSDTSSTHAPGEPWTWTPPDPFITPSSGPPQSGTTI